jgi:hypothetical protein
LSSPLALLAILFPSDRNIFGMDLVLQREIKPNTQQMLDFSDWHEVG